MPDASYPLEISVRDAHRLLSASPPLARIIDVREPAEHNICAITGGELIPMATIPQKMPSFSKEEHLLILCHHGHRSRRVTQYLRANGFDRVSNLTGGIEAWAEEIDSGMARY